MLLHNHVDTRTVLPTHTIFHTKFTIKLFSTANNTDLGSQTCRETYEERKAILSWNKGLSSNPNGVAEQRCRCCLSMLLLAVQSLKCSSRTQEQWIANPQRRSSTIASSSEMAVIDSVVTLGEKITAD